MPGKKYSIITITILLCAVIILLAHFQYFSTQSRIIRLHGEKQTILAKQVALSVENFIAERMNALQVLTEHPSMRALKSQLIYPEFKFVYNKIGAFKQIFFLNKNGRIVNSYPETFDPEFFLPDSILQKFLALFNNNNQKTGPIVSKEGFGQGRTSFTFLLIPVYNLKNHFEGILIGMIDLSKSVSRDIKPVISLKDSHTFILSQDGELIYHPSHPEMIHNNINDNDGHCITCHKNFAIEKQMIVSQSGWGEKTETNKHKKLIAYAKINLPGVSWSVAVDSPFRTITRANNQQFQIFLILSAAIVTVILIGSTILYRIQKQKLEIEKERDNCQREHLAIIGEMSTRIAHEIKNPLASLQAGIQLLESNLTSDKDGKEYYQRLTGEVLRVDRIVKGLLSYAHEDDLKKSEMDIGELILNVIELIKPTIKNSKIEWQFNTNGSNTVVFADKQKIEQVMWNCLLNAVQSIGDSGIIKIDVTALSNKQVQIVISDNGKGIARKNMNKIFQPFYSTKTQGTGLGLAICKKIVSAHRGKIEIISKEKKGTTVKLTLPQHKK